MFFKIRIFFLWFLSVHEPHMPDKVWHICWGNYMVRSLHWIYQMSLVWITSIFENTSSGQNCVFSAAKICLRKVMYCIEVHLCTLTLTYRHISSPLCTCIGFYIQSTPMYQYVHGRVHQCTFTLTWWYNVIFQRSTTLDRPILRC